MNGMNQEIKRICLACRKDFDAHSQLFTIFISEPENISQYREVNFQWNITLPHTRVPVDICFDCFYAALECKHTERRICGQS